MSQQNDKKRMNDEDNFEQTVKKQKGKKKKAGLVAFVTAVIFIAVGLYFCYTKLFFVEKLDISVSEQDGVKLCYSEEEVYEGLGIKKGMGLYDFSASDAEENAKYALPYFETVKISRRWPSTVVVKATLEKPSFYCSIADKMYIVSDNLKVLENTVDTREIGVNSLIYLKASGIHNCIEGEKLGIDKDTEEILLGLIEKLSEHDVLEKITSIDVTNKFDITMMYGQTYFVKLDDAVNLDTKIRYLKRIVEERKDNPGGGTIDLRNVEQNEAKFDRFG